LPGSEGRKSGAAVAVRSAEHRDKFRDRERYRLDPERMRAWARAYYWRNREAIFAIGCTRRRTRRGRRRRLSGARRSARGRPGREWWAM